LLEPGETVEETARREAREETGLEADDLELLGIFSGPTAFHIYPNGDQVHYVTIAYLSRNPQGELRFVDGEATATCSFYPEELPADEIHPPDRPILQAYIQWYRDGGFQNGRKKGQS
jgi:ADP-ribose pyrophosphatase YjhB (NUDIX family)